MNAKARRSTSISAATAKKVLLLIDWENLFFSLAWYFGVSEVRLEDKISKLMKWVKDEVGELLGGYGFVFAPEHLSHFHQQICVQNGLRLIICPKRRFEKPKMNKKTGEMVLEEDTVDETLIWFAETMLRHPNFKFVCLVSGDNDYVPLLKEMGRHCIKRALVAPTRDCLSKSKELTELVDKHPTTLRRMSMRLDKA